MTFWQKATGNFYGPGANRVTVGNMSAAPERRPFQVPWQEVAKRAGHVPDMSPLSPDEREELRQRLNTPGHRGLTPREQAERSRMGVIRRAGDVGRVEAKARAELAGRYADVWPGDEKWDLKQYTKGILAAVLWATGRARETPLSGKSGNGQPTAAEMWSEAILGEEIAAGRRESCQHRYYGTGVEGTLLWLIARVDDPPM